MRTLLFGIAALACTALVAMPQLIEEATRPLVPRSDVSITTPMGDTLQVMKQRYPKGQLQQTNGEQTLSHSYTHKGHTITIKTTRFDFNGHGAWEDKKHWLDRHAKAVADMEKAFPPDPKLMDGGGDAVGSLPKPEHVGQCPPGASREFVWYSEIPSQPGTYYRVVHHAHQAVPPIFESEAEFLARVVEAQAEADLRWPAKVP